MKKKFVYVKPVSANAKDRFVNDMDSFHSQNSLSISVSIASISFLSSILLLSINVIIFGYQKKVMNTGRF